MDMFGAGDAPFDLNLADEYSTPYPQTDSAATYRVPRPGDGISGAELRRRLITPEALAAIHEEEPKKTLLQRLFRR